jgi:DNA-binding PadR family transcriptional regulator
MVQRRGSDPGTLLLVSLAAGPKHGHAMMLDVEAFSGRRLGPGTLYGALELLDSAGFIEALPSEDRRTPYRLTEAGSAHLAQRLAEMDLLARVGLERVRK